MSPGSGTGTPISPPAASSTSVGVGGCSSRYAEAWEYAAFWCVASILLGADNGGGAGVAVLTDTQVNFINAGVKPGVGMVLYNLTTGINGLITVVTGTTITATGVTWSNGNLYRLVAINKLQRSTIEHYLDITAPDMWGALSASGACDCTLSTHGAALLKKLNILEAGIFHDCPCGRPGLSDAEKASYLEWVTNQLEKIQTGKLELCNGETGSDFPAIGWAEQSVTEFAAANIIINNYQRGSKP